MSNKTLLILATFVILLVTVLVVGFTGVNADNNSSNQKPSYAMTGSNTIYNDKENNADNKLENEEEKEPDHDDANQNDDKNDNDYNSKNEEEKEPGKQIDLTAIVSKKSIVKTKEKIGEVTTFVLKFKVFVTNNSANEIKLLNSGFDAFYDIKQYASLYSFDCTESNDSQLIKSGEIVEFDFSAKYIITGMFDEDGQYALDINYLGFELVSVLV